MKIVALTLILNILLLASFPGSANGNYGKARCCTEQIKKSCDHHQPSNNDCSKGNCNTLLPCGTCGFVIVETTTISPLSAIFKRQLIAELVIAKLSDYQDKDWNPPKA